MITLHFYNNKKLQEEVVTPDMHKPLLLHAKQGEFINIKHHCKDYEEDEYRKVLDIRYNGGIKEIHLSNHRY